MVVRYLGEGWCGSREGREAVMANRDPDRQRRTHTSAPIERITLAPTVTRDLRERRSAQRLPAFS